MRSVTRPHAVEKLWPGLDRWVSASETTNRGVSSHNRSPTLLPYCLTTDEEPRLANTQGQSVLQPAPRQRGCPVSTCSSSKTPP